MTTYNIILYLRDSDGNERQTGLFLSSLSSFGEGVAIANTMASFLEGISNAVVYRGELIIKEQFIQNSPPDPASNVYERLHILFTDTYSYGSITIPSPGSLHYDEAGPYRGIRVTPGSNDTSTAIEALRLILLRSVLPDGSPFPAQKWVAGRSMNQ